VTNLSIALPVTLIFLCQGYQWIKGTRRFPLDSLFFFCGVILVGKEININLVVVRLNFVFPLWIPCVMYLLINSKNANKYFVSQRNTLKCLLYGMTTGLALGCLINYFYGYQQQTAGIWVWIYQLFTVLGEELFFRGILLGTLMKSNVKRWVSILIQGLIFLAGHSRYFASGNWIAIIGVLLIGVSAGIITTKFRNILGAIVLHAVYNLFFFLPVA
jgi:membrane protease YdiL (CAAX protease family)